MTNITKIDLKNNNQCNKSAKTVIDMCIKKNRKYLSYFSIYLVKFTPMSIEYDLKELCNESNV